MDETIYTNVEAGSIPVFRFNHLRQQEKLMDIVIVTKEGHEIAAHRLVLCTRFPLIRDKILSNESIRIEWKRFPTNIVKAAVDYAYTGNAKVNSNNVTGLYLLAHNLWCSQLIRWCVDYMRSRITLDNLEEMWFIANATVNKDLIDECVPLIAVIFEGLSDSLTALLNALRLSSVTEETKLRAIATWLDAPILLADRRARASSFEHVLSTVDLKRLSDTLIVGITSGKSDIKFSEECRKILVDSWKKARRVRASSLYPSNHSAKSNSTNVVESIFFHAWDEESAYGILASLPQLQDVGNTRYCAPYRRNCSVAVLKDNVYIIGGKDDGGKSVSQVEKVNLCNGQIYSITPMSSSRSGASAVASERCIFVFGGYDKTRNIILSSCEEYDPIIGRWTALPNMPTARYASGAIYIPNVGELVVGGYEGIGKSASDLHTAELLLNGEPGSEGDRIWCTITPMLQSRCWPTGVYFDGRVFVARGGDDSVEALTLSSGHWTLISRCFVVDSYPFSMTVFSGRLLLAADNGTIYELRESTDSKGLQLPEFVWNPICKLNNVSHVTLISSSPTKGPA
ncbi:Kelch-like protein 12 [Echinococcus granulosus]|nr:Kelch-like protein 12 [Echinococcus granulosus]KAH9278424.1 Kelch-like protein 12 [Echinococcus granulosus]